MNFRFRELPIAIALLAICAFFAVKEPAFLGARNLSMLVTELSITATLAMGMLLILLPGHIDLSAGSGVGLLGGVASVLVFHYHLPAPAALGLGLLCGIFIWMAMGAFIVCERMPAFIVTLGALLIFKGLFWLVIDNATVPVAPGGQSNLYSLLTTYYLPVQLGWLLAVGLVLALVFTTLSARKRRLEHGFAVEDKEMAFLRLFITAQAIALFVLVTGQFRGMSGGGLEQIDAVLGALGGEAASGAGAHVDHIAGGLVDLERREATVGPLADPAIPLCR